MGNFAAEPVFFEGEEKDEQVLIIIRSHFVTNLGWLITSLIMLGLPLFIWGLLVLSNIKLPFHFFTGFLIVVTWWLIIIGLAFQLFLHWYFNLYILTNKRIVDIDFIGLFHRRVSQTTLNNIQDVTYSKGGILQNFLDFGDIHIQTAGEAANFEFYAVPDPEGRQKEILELMTKIREARL